MASNGHTTDSGRRGIKVLHSCRIAPALPPCSDLAPPPPVATLELTRFDMFLLSLPPVQRLFLYRLPWGDDGSSGREHFLRFHLPRLKCALSHALAVFYPLAGHFVRPDLDTVPFVRYEDGDAVDLNVVESQDDFEALAGDAPKESARLFPFVSDLTASQEEATTLPVLAIQVTLFPGRGVAVGVTVHHAVADGPSSTHFVKTWAAFCRQLRREQDGLQGDGVIKTAEAAELLLPIFDRSVVQDPKGLRDVYFADMLTAVKQAGFEFPKPIVALLRATFPLSPADLDFLRRRAAPPPGTRYSSFTVACALAWVCVMKARGKLEDDDEKMFSFAANLRSRIRPPLPAAYFGNCLGGGMAHVKTADLVGDGGLAVAAAAIWTAVQDLHDGGLMIRLGEDVIKFVLGQNWSEAVSVAGSPSLRVYEVDFGWGRPAKVEVLSSEKTGGISLAETADGRGGIEVGVPLPPEAMPEFERLWRSALKTDG